MMEEKRTGKVLSALKTSRAKLHSGGHSKHPRHKKWMPHAPHPALNASQQKFARKKGEDIRAYFKRLGLPPQKKGESTTNYAKRLGILEDLGSTRNSTTYFNRLADAVARNYGDALDGKKAAPKPLTRNQWVKKRGNTRGYSQKNVDKIYNQEVAAYNAIKRNITPVQKSVQSAPKTIAPEKKSTEGEVTETTTPKEAVTQGVNMASKAPKAKTTAQIQKEADAAITAADPRKGMKTVNENILTKDSQIEQVAAPTDVKAQTVDAPDMAPAATVSQTAITQGVPAAQATEMEAVQAEELAPTQAATGQVSMTAEADAPELSERAVTAERDTQAEQAAQAQAADFEISEGSYVDKVTGKTTQVAPTPEAEAQQREAILGTPAPAGEAAEIMSMYEYNEMQNRAIQGAEAKQKAIKELKRKGLKDDEIAQQLADNPELIADQMEELPETIKTTLSGLPQEALVSVQMESLLAGMEEGEIPAWARPALKAVENKLAARGMSRSSVGRDALFNAVIQSAIPIAQSNAQAIQDATSQDKQIASSFLAKNAEFQQQMDLANMSNDQQMRLANLSALNAASSDNLNAAQQTELANLNARMQTNITQANIAAQMGVAQLNVDQQRAVENASMVANVDLTKFSAEQQVVLANSKFMQTMVQTEFNADQQTMLQNATATASMDLATADQATRLAITNAQNFLQMDMTNLNNEQQALMFDQQSRQQTLLSNQSAENAARQFNAASQTDVDKFMSNLSATIKQQNAAQLNAMRQFNVTEINRQEAIKAGNELEAEKATAQLKADVEKFNEQVDLQRDQWNAANAQAVEQSNITWRRQANTANTAAQNAANQQHAQNVFNISNAELAQLWQQLRDESSYLNSAYENDQNRKTQLYAVAIGNEANASQGRTSMADIIAQIDKIFK
jgi:hypothetical protein